MEPARESDAPHAARRAPSAADWALTAALAVGLVPIGIVELVGAARLPGDAAWLWATIALTVVLHLSVAFRRASPRAALLVASAAMLGLVVASLPALPFDAVLLPSSLVFLVHVYTAASDDDRLRDVAALGIGAVGAALMIVVSVPRGPAEPGPVIALAGFLLASVGAAWALGRYRREARRKRAAQELGLAQAAELRAERQRAAVVEERRLIGRELHDVVSHSVAVMVAQAEAARVLLGRDEERARRAVEQVVRTGRAAMGDLRGLLGVLADDAAAAPRTPSPGQAELAALVASADGLELAARLVEHGTPRPLSPGAALAVHRLVQESLTNTLKHAARPGRVEVRLDWGDAVLVVAVHDEGERMPEAAPPVVTAPRAAPDADAGRGIRGMRERVEQLGGGFEAGPVPHGWRVRASLPLAPEAEPEAEAQLGRADGAEEG